MRFQANPEGVLRRRTERKPPDELILNKMRILRQKERKMFNVCREVLQFFFFWWIVLMIAYGKRDPSAFQLSTSIKKAFLDLGDDSDLFNFPRGSAAHDISLVKRSFSVDFFYIKNVTTSSQYISRQKTREIYFSGFAK